MSVDVKVPAVGESITEATIAAWEKKSGDYVKQGEVLLSLETDKATVEVVADAAGVLTIKANAGTVVKIGASVGSIDTNAQPTASTTAATAPIKTQATPTTTTPTPAAAKEVLSPAVRRIVTENNIDTNTISGTGKDGRLTKADVLGFEEPSQLKILSNNPTTRMPMNTLRKRIAQRLVEAQHTAAILTTFNEIDMSNVNQLRARYKEQFKEKYNVGLGLMGFFTKACIEALKAFPEINASIEGDDIIYKNYYHIGVAVGTEKGLIVPVVKNADKLSIAEIELTIKKFALKAKEQKITIADLSDGSFTISNGGVYGSLMSTPILNPPQSGILGMHKIEDRPVAINGKVEIRPMMYVALSYDHRIVDGKGAVSFLVKIKECIEDPERILLEV